ncbi:MAG: RNA-binding cell elongation regulator Jag/EloR [Andreesenia angusta]|nr:RNA-binding cell elongation regulator Jag/EloR [Andreesenia angusta]
MPKSNIQSAKTIEEAVKLALAELDAKREEVTVNVLEEPSRGFLGLIGSKDAKVEVIADKKSDYILNNLIVELLEAMNIKGDIKIEEENNNLKLEIINLDSKDEGILIGKRGSTLDAIQYYLTISLNKYVKGYKKVLLNISNYREKREETLKELAKKLANSVERNRRPIKLEPMNAYERKIIHSELQSDQRVKTFSEGEEPNRRLVISLK